MTEKADTLFRKRINNLVTLVLVLVLIALSIQATAQSNGSASIDDQKVTHIDFKAENYDLSFKIYGADVKNAFMAKAKNFQYAIEISLEGADACGSSSLTNWQDTYSKASLAEMGKKDDPFTTTLSGKEVNGSIKSALERCGWPSDPFKAVFSLIVPNKSGKMMTISTISLSVPSQSISLASSKDDIIKLFNQGLAAKAVDDEDLESSVERYMENKWPSENITTIHVTDLQYQNVAKTLFKVNGYYITRSNNVCKYNNFYGDGSKDSNEYAITFFNSMNAETSIDCSAADELTNR